MTVLSRGARNVAVGLGGAASVAILFLVIFTLGISAVVADIVYARHRMRAERHRKEAAYGA